jgi:hypothetical protein
MAALLTVATVGCSSKSSDDVSAESSTTTEAPAGNDGEGSSATNDDSSGDDTSGSGSGVLDDLQTCGSVSALAVTLGLGAAFLTDDQKAEVEQQLDELQGKVPDEIEGDIETLRNGAENADSLQELGTFLDSDEYSQAMDNIGQYLEETCDIGGSGN